MFVTSIRCDYGVGKKNSKKTHLHNHQVLDNHTYGLYMIHLHKLQLSLLLELINVSQVS
jgi:hypothetical protein